MGIAEMLAGAGLNLGHLQNIFERDGENGFRNTFSCKNCEGQPRVEEIIPKLGNFFSCAENA